MSRVVVVPREIKNREGRVSMQPDGAYELAHHGHEVVVEKGARRNAGFPDEEHEAAGASPTYVKEGVVHYCVANIPGAVARTSTSALTSVTLPYLLKIADLGMEGAAREDAALAKGLSTLRGSLVSEPVAEAHGLPYEDHRKILG